jgi:hypothetical protein
MSTVARYDETITLPRAVRFPVELLSPDGFDEERLETWPSVAGRLECVEGRLLFLPPSGDAQQDVVTDVVITLGGMGSVTPRLRPGDERGRDATRRRHPRGRCRRLAASRRRG